MDGQRGQGQVCSHLERLHDKDLAFSGTGTNSDTEVDGEILRLLTVEGKDRCGSRYT